LKGGKGRDEDEWEVGKKSGGGNDGENPKKVEENAEKPRSPPEFGLIW